MDMIVIICSIILIITILLMWIITTYNNFQRNLKKIELAKDNINSLIREEYDILNNVSTIICEISNDEDAFKNFKDLKAKRLSNFEMDRKLKDYIAEYYKYKEKLNEEFNNNESLIKQDEKLDEIIEFIKGAHNYYNDSVINYNKKITMFPNIIISKLTGKKKQDLYEDLENNFKI